MLSTSVLEEVLPLVKSSDMPSGTLYPSGGLRTAKGGHHADAAVQPPSRCAGLRPAAYPPRR